METSAAPIPFSRFPARWLLVLDDRIAQKRGVGLAYVLATGETIAVAATKECHELPEHPCPSEEAPWGEQDPATIWETAARADQSPAVAPSCDPYSAIAPPEFGIPAPIHCI